jgi:glycosyltransferase involved in cell wall biosynthesis
MNRSTYLELLQAGHIFFSPTCSEGYGMGLVEAACSGMAVVSTCGTGMEHISEVFETGRNAYLVENSLPFDQKIRAFHQIISMLLEDSQERERLARNCLELTTRGRLSVGCRNEKLLTYYQRMLEGYDAIAAEGEARMGEIRMRNGLISRCFPEKELHSRYRRHSAGTERRVWVT